MLNVYVEVMVTMFVHLLMHKDFAVISPNTSLREVIRLLNVSDIGALPLMEGGSLKGLITRRKLDHRITELLMAGVIVDFDDVVLPVAQETLTTLSSDAIIEEAAYLLSENDVDALPVVESDDTLVGIISEKDIRKAFSQMLGFNTPGSRLTIRVADAPGKLAEISAAISRYDVSIVSIAAYTAIEGYRDLVLRVGTDNPQDIVNDLRSEGYKVVHVCQVWD